MGITGNIVDPPPRTLVEIAESGVMDITVRCTFCGRVAHWTCDHVPGLVDRHGDISLAAWHVKLVCKCGCGNPVVHVEERKGIYRPAGR